MKKNILIKWIEMAYNFPMMKQVVRYYGGLVLKKSYLLPTLRKIYFFTAKKYLQKLNPTAIKGAWVRRSLTTQDFVPLWSDIDLTILINEDLIGQIKFPTDLLVKDLQIISDQHLSSWLRTGGFRNRQIPKWIELQGNTVLTPPTDTSNEILAFELAQEIYLIYQQLERKLHQTELLQWQIETTYKLVAELERLNRYWKSKDEKIIFLNREEILPRITYRLEEIGSYLQRFEASWQEIFKSLALPLQQYPLEESLETETDDYGLLYFSILNRPVLVVKDAKKIVHYIKEFPENFVCTETFARMIKGIGIQEQTLLNQIAKDKNYYFQFNLQRLANDLIGSVLVDTNNQTQLYYCFKNINDFHPVPGWKDIDFRWQNDKIVHRNSQELLTLASRFLEVLRSLR